MQNCWLFSCIYERLATLRCSLSHRLLRCSLSGPITRTALSVPQKAWVFGSQPRAKSAATITGFQLFSTTAPTVDVALTLPVGLTLPRGEITVSSQIGFFLSREMTKR